MTEQRTAADGWFTRWRERGRAKRQEMLERELSVSPRPGRVADAHEQERLNPATRAYTDADNHARRWTSFLGGGP